MLDELVTKAVGLDKLSIGRLISHFEDTRDAAAHTRERIIALLVRGGSPPKARYIGVTGSPGVGKSSLIGEIATRLMKGDTSVAVVAVDPSSSVSGGAFLGDRTRVRFPIDEPRLFFRSQASDTELGGVSRHTYQVCRLLGHLFDYVFIETVGIGQSEIEIQFVADRTLLVLQPMAGDQVQFMKAGIMEVPDVFILNKSDQEEEAARSYHALRSSLTFIRPGEEEPVNIIRTSTVTGEGIAELLADITSLDGLHPRHTPASKERYFFEKWVRDEYGRHGYHVLGDTHGGAGSFLEAAGSFDRAQYLFAEGFAGRAGARD